MKSRRILRWAIPIGLALLLLFLVIPYLYLAASRSYQEVTIPAEGYQLTGYLSKGTSSSGPWVILGHGNRKSGQAHELYQRIQAFLPKGVTVLAIDFRGFGKSPADGLAESEAIINRDEDIQAAVNYLIATQGAREDQIVLIGHSLGATQVMEAALHHSYRLSLPIGLGNWQQVLDDPRLTNQYIQKFQANTGLILTPEDLAREGSQLTPRALFGQCPQTPVVLVFAQFDEGRKTIAADYRAAHERCNSKVNWVIIPFADHMYGTESARLIRPLRSLYSTISLSVLKWQLDRFLISE